MLSEDSLRFHGRQCKYTKSWRAHNQSQLHEIQRTNAGRQKIIGEKQTFVPTCMHCILYKGFQWNGEKNLLKLGCIEKIKGFFLKMQLEKNIAHAHRTKRMGKKVGNYLKEIQFSQVQSETKKNFCVYFFSLPPKLMLCSVKLKVFNNNEIAAFGFDINSNYGKVGYFHTLT